jgi:preprotein translocase subunit YajC
MDFFINTAHAQAAGAGGGQGIMSALMLPLVLLVVFYFLLIRPQNKRAKEQREMLSKIAQAMRSRLPAEFSARSPRWAISS